MQWSDLNIWSGHCLGAWAALPGMYGCMEVKMGAEVHLGEHRVSCGFGQYMHGTVPGQSGITAQSVTYYFTLA